MGQTYRNTESAKQFTEAIAHTARQSLAADIRSAQFVSLLSDGSTDSSITEQELFYIRCVVNGMPTVKFVAAIHVEGGDAISILAAMNKAVSQYLNIEWEELCPKLIALGCDGASVTTGHRNGLFGLLKQEQPSVVLIHCLAHRLELAFCDASKSSGLHEKAVSTLLMGLYYFYRNSTLNRSMLKRAGASLGIKNVLVPNRVCTTRWVGHLHRSIEIVLKSYPIIVTHLQQITQTDIKINTIQAAKAKCFLKLLLTKDVVLYLHLLLDICEPLRKLSNAFQERSAVVSDVYRAISSSIVILKKLNTNPGSHLQKVVDLDDFCGHALSGNDGSFKASKIKMLTNLNSALEKHFGDFKEGIFKFCDIAKFNSWPLAANTDEIQDFGDKEVRKIMDHFHDVLVKAGSDLDCIENQWTSLKSVIYDEHEAADITHLTWPNIVRKYQDSHQDILCVIDIILSLPASSAEVERGFSSLKLLKNDFRSRSTLIPCQQSNIGILLEPGQGDHL